MTEQASNPNTSFSQNAQAAIEGMPRTPEGVVVPDETQFQAMDAAEAVRTQTDPSELDRKAEMEGFSQVTGRMVEEAAAASARNMLNGAGDATTRLNSLDGIHSRYDDSVARQGKFHTGEALSKEMHDHGIRVPEKVTGGVPAEAALGIDQADLAAANDFSNVRLKPEADSVRVMSGQAKLDGSAKQIAEYRSPAAIQPEAASTEKAA